MHFIATIASAAALLSLTSAAPHSVAKRANLQALCPAGATYYGANACSSGFVGCLDAADNWACTRTKKFDENSCDGFGFFTRCDANGWIGCAKTDMCMKATPGSSGTAPPVVPPVVPQPPTSSKCPAGSVYVEQGKCKTGFVGCISSNVPCADYCDGLNGQNYQGWCPFGSGIFLNCATGFYGCTTETNKCDPKA